VRRLLAGCAVVLFLAAMGAAQTGPAGEKPFTGFHFGGYAGGTWQKPELTMSAEDTGAYIPTEDVANFNLFGRVKPEETSFVGGGSFGYDYQNDENWVFGFEVTFGAMHLDKTTASGDIPYINAGYAPATYNFNQHIDTSWLFEVRPRAGYRVGNWMPYVTGGLSLTNVQYRGTFTDTFGPTTEQLIADETRAGLNIGGGVEFKPNKHFSLRGEYLYTDFGQSELPHDGFDVGPGTIVTGQPVTRDDSNRFRFEYDLEREDGDTVENENLAYARASCERCRTTAIAVQIVLVSSKPSTVTPVNLAVALNDNCTSCQTFATAFQFVVGVDDASVRFTKAGKAELKRIIGEFRSLRHETYTLDEFHTRTGALADRIRTVLRTQLVSKGDDDEPDVRVREDTEAEQG